MGPCRVRGFCLSSSRPADGGWAATGPGPWPRAGERRALGMRPPFVGLSPRAEAPFPRRPPRQLSTFNLTCSIHMEMGCKWGRGAERRRRRMEGRKGPWVVTRQQVPAPPLGSPSAHPTGPLDWENWGTAGCTRYPGGIGGPWGAGGPGAQGQTQNSPWLLLPITHIHGTPLHPPVPFHPWGARGEMEGASRWACPSPVKSRGGRLGDQMLPSASGAFARICWGCRGGRGWGWGSAAARHGVGGTAPTPPQARQAARAGRILGERHGAAVRSSVPRLSPPLCPPSEPLRRSQLALGKGWRRLRGSFVLPN